MTKKLLFTLLSVFLSVMTVVGQVTQSVNVSQPGGLSAAIGSNLKTVTDLTLTGTINATDFETIKQMTALQNLNMSKVSVADNTIPAGAFQNRVLNSLTLPEGVKILGDGSFRASQIKTGLSLPSSLVSIGAYAFIDSPIAVDFSKAFNSLETIGYQFLSGYSGSSIMDFSQFTKLTDFRSVGGANVGAFTGYNGHVILPVTMETLPAYSFAQFKGTVDLPQGLKTIGSCAFTWCNLERLDLPQGVKILGDGSFRASQIKTGLSLPSSLVSIGAYAFIDSPIAVDFSKAFNSLETIGYQFLSGYSGSSIMDFSQFTKLTDFRSVGGANVGAFTGYNGHVILPVTMETLPAYSFAQFKGTVDLPQGLKTIGSCAFTWCNLERLDLPQGVKILGDGSFRASQIKTGLSLPSSLVSIGAYAFVDSPIAVDFSKAFNSLETIGYQFLSGYSGSSIMDFSQFTKLTDFRSVGGANVGAFTGYNGHVILPVTMETLPAYSFAQFKGTVDLPQGLKTIGSCAFTWCNLERLDLPQGVKILGDGSFRASQIKTGLSLPSSLVSIGAYAFIDSPIAVDFSKAFNSLETIGYQFLSGYSGSSIMDFSQFTKLTDFRSVGGANVGAFTGYNGHVILPVTMETLPAYSFAQFKGTVDLPQGLKTIGSCAFTWCNLERLDLPQGVKILGDGSFRASQIKTGLSLPSSLVSIGAYAFIDSPIAVDFSKAFNSLETIGYQFLSGYSGSSIMDFSQFTKLTDFRSVGGANVGAFTGYNGHVILPVTMETLPAYSFAQFKGTVDLPQGLKTIGSCAFTWCNLERLDLPQGVKILGDGSFRASQIKTGLSLPSSLVSIGAYAFIDSPIAVDFSKAFNSLETIGYQFLSGYSGSSIMDFSQFTKLTDFRSVGGANVGAFTGYNGHVILPVTMETLPAYSFAQFKGTVDLPQGLKTIGNNAFRQSTIKKIDLPSNVTSIGNNAFYNASQLDTIISHNTTPPALGNNVFGGLNKETTQLIVPESSIKLYGTADQWKDFLNVNVTIPKELNLLYRIGIGHDSNSNYNIYDQGAIEVNYKAVRIGEYYWMTSNFSHVEPFRKRWGTIRSGDEVDYPMTQEVLNTYLRRMHTDSTQFQVDINEFNNQFGLYYSSYSIQYMNEWGRIFENNAGAENRQWSLPRMADFRQLIGMSPFQKANTTSELSVHDAMYALAAGRSSHPILNYFITDDCGGNWNYWANYGDAGGDIYGFGFTPGGNRLNGPFNQRFMAKGCYDDRVDIEKGSLIQLFHRAQLAGLDGNLSFHEVIDTRQGADYHWLPVRWCRPLTDQELGYKLYINISNIDKNGSQWQTLVGGNEIPLLNYMRNNKIPTDQTSILKLGLKEEVPAGFVELPHGYIRGFYVQYLLDNPTSTLKISDIMEYAYGVQDEALEYVQEQGRPSSKSTTRSISADDVVIPFRTSSEVRIYPNPVQEVLNVSGEGVEKISLYDLSGRQLQSVSNASSIQMSGLTAGTYIVRVQTASGESVHKVMKK